MPVKFSLSVAAMCLAATTAFAQSNDTAPKVPADDSAPRQILGIGDGDSNANVQMMREMMREMMQNEFRREGRRDDRQWRGGGERRHHRAELGSDMKDDRSGMHMRGKGMHSGMMMRGGGMRLMFAIVDADGDGALSLQEVNGFHARVFNAVDENGDGSIDMSEIREFFGPERLDAED